MKRHYLVIVSVLIAASAIYFLWPYAVPWYFSPSIPKPRSDIPITTEIGWWAYQDGLVVDSLTAEAVDPQLSLVNNRFLLRYRISGTLTHWNGWRPRLVKAQITGRLVSRGAGDGVADFVIVPIIEVTEDSAYANHPIPFAVTLEQVVETMNWGVNRYDVHCLDQTTSVTVNQHK